VSGIVNFGYSEAEWQGIRSTVPTLADDEDITLSVDSSHIDPDRRFTLRCWLGILANGYLLHSGIDEKTTHVSARLEHKLLRDVSKKFAALLEAIDEAERANCISIFLADRGSSRGGKYRLAKKAHDQSIVALRNMERNVSDWASLLPESRAWNVGRSHNASDLCTNLYLSEVLFLWTNNIQEQNKSTRADAARFLTAVANPVLKKKKRAKDTGTMREWINREIKKPTVNRS